MRSSQGLSAIRGLTAYLILSGIGASVPFGPWNMGVVWVVVRGWGIANQPATSGIALYGVINQLGRLALPLLAVDPAGRDRPARPAMADRRS